MKVISKNSTLRRMFATLLVIVTATVLVSCSQAQKTNHQGTTTHGSKANKVRNTTTAKRATGRKQVDTKTNDYGKTLLVYYSLTDTTAKLAQRIQRESGSDSVRLQPEHAYPTTDNDAVNAWVKLQQRDQRADQLTNTLPDLSQYQSIIIGFPIWSGDVAYPLQSFLMQNAAALAGKRLVPFSTSAQADATAVKQTRQTIQQLVPDSQIMTGLDLTSSVASANRIDRWLQRVLPAQ